MDVNEVADQYHLNNYEKDKANRKQAWHHMAESEAQDKDKANPINLILGKFWSESIPPSVSFVFRPLRGWQSQQYLRSNDVDSSNHDILLQTRITLAAAGYQDQES